MNSIKPTAQLLFDEAEKLGLKPHWETHYGLFSITVNGKVEYVFYTRLHSNSRLGAWMAKNKQAAHIVLEKSGITMIPYCYSLQLADVLAFFKEHEVIVQKPLYGFGSDGVLLIKDKEQLEGINVGDYIFEAYIAGAVECRYLVLDGEIIGVQEKTSVADAKNQWKKSTAVLNKSEWNAGLCKTAIQVASILHLNFAGVDFLADTTGKNYVLEVNSRPGLDAWYHPDAGEPLAVGKILLEKLFVKDTKGYES